MKKIIILLIIWIGSYCFAVEINMPGNNLGNLEIYEKSVELNKIIQQNKMKEMSTLESQGELKNNSNLPKGLETIIKNALHKLDKTKQIIAIETIMKRIEILRLKISNNTNLSASIKDKNHKILDEIINILGEIYINNS